MHRYNIIDALMFAGLLAVITTCFRQGGPSAGCLMLTMFFMVAFLGYKSAFVQLRREAEHDKKDNS